MIVTAAPTPKKALKLRLACEQFDNLSSET
jgi:hypothetical protein